MQRGPDQSAAPRPFRGARAEDPVGLRHRTGRAPAPPWLVRWERRHAEGLALSRVVERGSRLLAESVAGAPLAGAVAGGEDGSDAAWMLAMHADADPVLQRRCLVRLEDAVAARDADSGHLATLADRVAATHVGRQRDGTLALPRPGGPHFLVPVEDPDGLARRRALGLPSVEDDAARRPASSRTGTSAGRRPSADGTGRDALRPDPRTDAQRSGRRGRLVLPMSDATRHGDRPRR